MLEGVVIFSGTSLPGPPLGPGHAPEGDVFSGISLAGSASGGSNLGSGGTIFPPGPPTPVPAPPSTTLVLYSSVSAIIAAYQRYSQINIGYGGIPPYTYSIVGGTLPNGTSLVTANGDAGNTGTVLGTLTSTEPFTYTVEVTDSSGIVSFTVIGGGTYNGSGASPSPAIVGGGIVTPADDQLVMMVCVTATENTSASFNSVSEIIADGLTFTRVFHDESFTYTDSAGDGSFPVAACSVDIFTAPAPTETASAVNWSAVMSNSGGFVNHGSIFILSVGGLKNINSPFDPSSVLPNIAVNTSGTSSAPTNTDVTTTYADDALFSLILNHNPSGDAAAVAPPGWINAGTNGALDNGGGSSGFSLLMSYLSVSSIQEAETITAGFSDKFWYSAVFGFEGAGGSPQTATQTISSGSVAPVEPGSQTFDIAGATGYFFAPPYNTLTVEVYGGSETGSQVISTLGGFTTAGPNGFAETIYTPTSENAPPVTGAMPYTIGTGSPGGMVIFTWS